MLGNALFIFIESAPVGFSYFPAMSSSPLLIVPFIFLLLAVLIPLLLIVSALMNRRKNRYLLANGELAPAKILKISDTGVTVNNNPQVRMTLEVYPPDRPIFQGEAKSVISRLDIPRIQVGSSVSVRFDPQDISSIALVLGE